MKIRFGKRKIYDYIFMVLGLAWTLTFSPIGSLLFNIGTVFGMGIGVFFMVIGFFSLTPRKVWNGFTGWKRILFRILAVTVAFCFVWIAGITGFILYRAAQKPREDATVIVLGCFVRGENPGRALRQRMDAAVEYLTSHPESVAVLSGGKGNGEDISEAEAMFRYMKEAGIEESRLIKEDQSTNTEENIRNSLAIIEERGLSENVAITTHSYHQGRASVEAMRYGLHPGAVNTEAAPFSYLTYFAREILGITEILVMQIPTYGWSLVSD